MADVGSTSVESHGVTQLTRNGITPAMLKPGTQLRIDGSQSRNDVHRCFFNNVYFPDGRALNVNGPTGAQAARPPGQAVAAARRDIFGTWLLAPMPGRLTAGPQQPMIQFLTDAGKAAVAKYNPFKDDPAFRCDPVAVRRVWGAPGHSTVDHASKRPRDPAPRMDGCAAHRLPEPARTPEGRKTHFARVIRSGASRAIRW